MIGQLPNSASINTTSMLSVFQARFQRLETALNTLVESVAAYNPSVSAADALVAADEDLEESLGQRKHSSLGPLCPSPAH